MTRQEIEGIAKEIANAQDGTPGQVSPILLHNFAYEGVKIFCRVVKNVYKIRRTDLIADQRTYAKPSGLLNVEQIEVKLLETDPQGWRQLSCIPSYDFEKLVPNYRNQEPLDPNNQEPFYAVFEGDSRIFLYPFPNYSKTDGLVWKGTGYYEGQADWPAPGSECPIDPINHMAIASYIAAQILKMKKDYSGYQAHLKDFLYAKGHAESEQGTLTESHKTRMSPQEISGIYPRNNPLNL